MVSRHWVDVGVWVRWEPGSGIWGAIRFLGRENFIDGSLWVRWQGRREMPELSCVNRPGWRGLSGGMYELLEVMAKHCGELGRMYPPMA